ncbi:hypothetical protein N7528_001463 [Penicillium herquei]|nr:hypothetical protein N7528_001463 [Penicillium herquei]
MGQKTVLDALESVCNVDVDSVDPRIATALPFKPHNQTSNQVICSDTMLLPEYHPMMLEKVRQFGSQGWDETFNQVMVQFCADNIKNITGRVLVQVSPSRVMSKERVLEQCYSFDRAFASHGISRDQYAIKISTTGPAMAAAAILRKQGIRVLGTSLFSLAQATAASQAGCLFISPYLNEVAAYSDDSLLHKSSDPALNHSMSPRLIHILEAYTQLYKEAGQEQPLIVMASNANINEIFATAELGCQHITVRADHIIEMANTPLEESHLLQWPFLANPKPKPETPYYKDLSTPDRFAHFNKIDPLAGADWDGKLADIHTDYISNDGKALVEAMQSDPAVVRKIKDVFDAFLDGERRAQVALQAEIDKIF